MTEATLRVNHRFQLAVFAATLLPLGALAQEAAPPMPQDPRAAQFREVERGAFAGFEVGYLMLFKTPVADPARYPYAPKDGGGKANGFVLGTTLGYDVTSRLALSIFALAGNAQATTNYGAFSLFAAGGDVRLALVGSRDANSVERFYLYLHGRAGYLVTSPEGLFGNHDLYLAGGPGIEYYTHLRHFSIGLAADVAYLPTAKTAGVAITPTFRYTF